MDHMDQNTIGDLLSKAAAAGEMESVITAAEEELLYTVAAAMKGLTLEEILKRLKG